MKKNVTDSICTKTFIYLDLMKQCHNRYNIIVTSSRYDFIETKLIDFSYSSKLCHQINDVNIITDEIFLLTLPNICKPFR